jgi:hypothetical protein
MRRAGLAKRKGVTAYNAPLQLGKIPSKPSLGLSFTCGCFCGDAITFFALLAWLLQRDITE